MCLELGIIPVRYVIMKKRLNFLHYILKETITSTVRQVYDTLKHDSRKGDFYFLIQKDLRECDIKMTEEEIEDHSKKSWKDFIAVKVKEKAFKELIYENSKLEHTKDIIFKELRLSNYLEDNRNNSLSKIIFSVRSRTLDIKSLQPWKYYDNLCVLCEKKSETIQHFMSCNAYTNVEIETDWKSIFEDNPETQFRVAENIRKRLRIRKRKIQDYEAGHPQEYADSRAPGDCRAV
jgi:hypothetical protein